jgi:hypothetical protein
MATYRMVYGGTVLFRDGEAILRVQDEHVQSLEELDDSGDNG